MPGNERDGAPATEREEGHGLIGLGEAAAEAEETALHSVVDIDATEAIAGPRGANSTNEPAAVISDADSLSDHMLAEEGEHPVEHLERLRSLRAFDVSVDDDEEEEEHFIPPSPPLAAAFSHRGLRLPDEDTAALPPISMCRICLDDISTPSRSAVGSRAVVHLRCACKGDLAGAHVNCAKRWVLAKGNGICEICGEEMQGVSYLARAAAARRSARLSRAEAAGAAAAARGGSSVQRAQQATRRRRQRDRERRTLRALAAERLRPHVSLVRCMCCFAILLAVYTVVLWAALRSNRGEPPPEDSHSSSFQSFSP